MTVFRLNSKVLPFCKTYMNMSQRGGSYNIKSVDTRPFALFPFTQYSREGEVILSDHS